jgi:hypothetical protein
MKILTKKTFDYHCLRIFILMIFGFATVQAQEDMSDLTGSTPNSEFQSPSLGIIEAEEVLLSDEIAWQEPNDIIGRWDLTLDMNGREKPSWLEVKLSGISTLVGYFVGDDGSARPSF